MLKTACTQQILPLREFLDTSNCGVTVQQWEFQTSIHVGVRDNEWRVEGVKGGARVFTGIYPFPRGTLQCAGPAAMLKPSVGSLSGGHVKQDVCCGLTFHSPNYNIIISWLIRLHFSLWLVSVSICQNLWVKVYMWYMVRPAEVRPIIIMSGWEND